MKTTTTNKLTRRTVRVALATALLAVPSVLSGCNNAGEGAFSGAALGALAGMGLGSLSGDMGKGAAAGAIIGGVGGAVLGDQNARRGGSGW
jgi:osmotically inducible lipoprotein OsmB